MTAPAVVSQHPIWVWIFRCGFFAFGAFIFVLSFSSGYFGPHGPIQAGLLIILSFLVRIAVRNPISWSLLTFTAIGAVLPLIGLGIVFGPAGGNQNTSWGGIGFLIAFLGLLGFYTSAITTLVVALRVLAHDWRERHGGTTAPPPTTPH